MKSSFTVKACPADYKKIGRREFKPTSIWYAYIIGENPKTGKREQIRYKKDLNRIKDLDERKFELSCLVDALKHKLSTGWNPFDDSTSSIPKIYTIGDALDYIIETKRPVLRKRSIESYIYASKQLQDWIFSEKLNYLPPKLFTQVQARSFLDSLLIKGASGRSHNNLLLFCKTLFNAMIDREIIVKNPFSGIKKLPTETGKNVAFTPAEVLAIDTVLKAYHKRLYYFKEFVYHAAIRRTELTLLRVRDIKDGAIILNSSVSKNRKQESVVINQGLKSIIQEMELHKYDPDDFIFGERLCTCSKQYGYPNHISNWHARILKKLNIRKECTLYSWKHTGAVNLYEASRDPYLIMNHLRHHSLEMTMIYLKSLGVNVDQRISAMAW